jgi:glycosyltransferase involved in cell wall biosynthesis
MRILAVHQSAELFGSDRMFARTLGVLRARYPAAHITAVLPRRGPLSPYVEAAATEVLERDLLLASRRELHALEPADVAPLLRRTRRRVAAAAAAIDAYDVTYVNTLVVLDFMLGSRWAMRPVIVHAREVLEGAERPVFSALLAASRCAVISNSVATDSALTLPPWRRRFVVPNGVGLASNVAASSPGPCMNVLVLGRYSPRKGHAVLLDALARLPPAERSAIRVRAAGATVGGDASYLRALVAQCDERGLGGLVEFGGFVEDTAPLYEWSDVVVVPSVRKESFGLVAAEAMSHGQPVIAADHGGLREVVGRNEGGLLVPPRDPAALAAALRLYLHRPDLRLAHGAAGRRRLARRFSHEAYARGIVQAFEAVRRT